MIDAPPKKVFHKPDSGLFEGVLADFLFKDNAPTKFGPKDTIRFKWILNAKDKDGNYYTVVSRPYNRIMSENSSLYKHVSELLGSAPPVPYNEEQLIGMSRNLVITRGPGIDKNGELYVNIVSSFPLKPDQAAFAVPAGFVRAKDRPAKGTQPTQTAASAPAQAAPAAPAQAAPAAAVSQVQDDSAEVDF